MFTKQQMNKVNFQEEFEKIARRFGMGEAISSSVVCYKAREVLKEVMDDDCASCVVISFENGLLTVGFGSSGALFKFNSKKASFLKKLNGALGKSQVAEIRAIMRSNSLD